MVEVKMVVGGFQGGFSGFQKSLNSGRDARSATTTHFLKANKQ